MENKQYRILFYNKYTIAYRYDVKRKIILNMEKYWKMLYLNVFILIKNLNCKEYIYKITKNLIYIIYNVSI